MERLLLKSRKSPKKGENMKKLILIPVVALTFNACRFKTTDPI